MSCTARCKPDGSNLGIKKVISRWLTVFAGLASDHSSNLPPDILLLFSLQDAGSRSFRHEIPNAQPEENMEMRPAKPDVDREPLEDGSWRLMKEPYVHTVLFRILFLACCSVHHNRPDAYYGFRSAALQDTLAGPSAESALDESTRCFRTPGIEG